MTFFIFVLQIWFSKIGEYFSLPRIKKNGNENKRKQKKNTTFSKIEMENSRSTKKNQQIS
ncbi:hypothetical protein Sjap_018073 [Stephania japonica]|uniref:Uncharacterized protein n=1 Tax=Stephania japonica TaxID=461633 RepID=A0AAP0I7I0_9MAGN